MKHYLTGLIMAALLLPLTATLCQADLLWDQEPAGLGKFRSASYYHSWTADDFMLDTVSAITTVSWWGGRGGNTPVIDGFHIRFYSDGIDSSTGQHFADQLLLEEIVSGDAGQTSYNSETYSYSATLSTAFTALANQHYWLSIQADTQNDPNDPWWGWQESNTTYLNPAEYNSSKYSHHPINQSPFYSGNHDMAFVLDGTPTPVPEPATLLLFGTGLVGVIGKGRKRQTIAG